MVYVPFIFLFFTFLFFASNVLRQSGTRLQPATLVVRIYRASDLPQMDPVYFEKVKKLFNSKAKPKNLVDPYCLVSYAGHRGKTPVMWNNQDPLWNHQINISVRVCVVIYVCTSCSSLLHVCVRVCVCACVCVCVCGHMCAWQVNVLLSNVRECMCEFCGSGDSRVHTHTCTHTHAHTHAHHSFLC